MAKEIGRYDGEIHQFVEPVHPVNIPVAKFIRWLMVYHDLEHPVAGEPSGDVALSITAQEGRDAINPLSKGQKMQFQARKELLRGSSLRSHIASEGDY